MSEGPKFPSTLAPEQYYQGLTERISTNLLPTFSRLFSSSPTCRKALEIASGNGLHSLVYSREFPEIEFQPTECDEFNCRRIDETCREVRNARGDGKSVGGVRKAIQLDVMSEGSWKNLAHQSKSGSLESEGGDSAKEEEESFDFVFGHNFIHMIPFPEGARSIFRNLVQQNLVSRSHGRLALYGPFKHDEGFFSQADEAFDKEISSRPSSYPLGLRSTDALSRLAQEEGWELTERIEMPRGNWTLVFHVKRQ